MKDKLQKVIKKEHWKYLNITKNDCDYKKQASKKLTQNGLKYLIIL